MIVITGAAGFIASRVALYFTEHTDEPLVLVDDFSRPSKQHNSKGLEHLQRVDRDAFFEWAEDKELSCIIHLGARTDTTEFDYDIFQRLNVDYTQRIWQLALEKNARLIYASSAATYGNGEHGYADSHAVVSQLTPLNPYGVSKNEVDKWVLEQREQPEHWYGLKFFNVYGPNEYHKGRMASVVFHAFNQIKERGTLRLFRSHHADYRDGEQLRDFIYVMDVCRVIWFLHNNVPASGLYNLGTGQARTFLDLGKAVFDALGLEPAIEFVDTPADIRDKYQYFTEADMSKLQQAGYHNPFMSLEEGVRDYVLQYLEPWSQSK